MYTVVPYGIGPVCTLPVASGIWRPWCCDDAALDNPLLSKQAAINMLPGHTFQYHYTIAIKITKASMRAVEPPQSTTVDLFSWNPWC